MEPACLPACLLVYLPACLPVCLSVCPTSIASNLFPYADLSHFMKFKHSNYFVGPEKKLMVVASQHGPIVHPRKYVHTDCFVIYGY